jgi:eukaryotic-like serine/threonine-protein kinase
VSDVAKVGKYQLVEKLGEGGMAEVFLAIAPGLAGFSKKLVLKRVRPELQEDAEQIEMFLDEARLAARLEHPNICQVFDLGEVNGQYFIVMEHVTGVTLTRVLDHFAKAGTVVPFDVSLRVLTQLLEALEYAHALRDEQGQRLNLVHRDVTPSNVMVTPQGSVKLLDFGIARASSAQHKTQAGITKGKLGYMSPEQCRGERLDQRSDLFAVGTLLYVMSTGKTPYGSGALSPAVFQNMVAAQFPSPSSVRPGLPDAAERVILKAMAAEPVDRYPRAFDMLKALEVLAGAERVSLGPNQLSELVQQLTGNGGLGSEAPQSRDAATRALPAPARPVAAQAPSRRDAETRALPTPARVGEAPEKPGPPVPSAAFEPVRRVPTPSSPVGVAGPLAPVPDAGPLAPLPDAITEPALPKELPAGVGRRAAARAQVNPLPSAPPRPRRLGLVAFVVGLVVAVAVAVSLGSTPSKPRRSSVVADPAQPQAAGAQTGVVSLVTASPAKVRFEGRELGETPLEVTLPVGTQRLQLLRPGVLPREVVVEVAVGQRTAWVEAQALEGGR